MEEEAPFKNSIQTIIFRDVLSMYKMMMIYNAVY